MASGDPLAGATSSVASETQAVGGPRDRDLPPFFDGSDPTLYKRYVRDIELWRHETDHPKQKHGVKMLRQLGGMARAAADELAVAEITSEKGGEAIMNKLREHFNPYLETALPRAFEKAIYAEHRKSKESLQEFIIRMDAAFNELAEEGVTLSDKIKGYVTYRHASLTSNQEDQVTTWTAGSFDRENVIKALRKLEKVQKEKPGKHYILDEDEGKVYSMENQPGIFLEEEDPDYVWINDGDLAEVYEEADIQEALATYQEVRKALRDQRTSRSSWGKGAGKGYSGPFRPRQEAGSRKVHVEMLKLRTKCARCGQIGHWAKECRNPQDSYARSKQDASRSTAGSASSAKSGFFSVQMEKDASVMWAGDSWSEVVTLGSFLKKDCKPSFVGLMTEPECGVVDTAAQTGLVGEKALVKLSSALGAHGLQVVWSDKKAQARGVGGEATVVGVAEVPLGIGGACGVLECTVVKEEVPLLLPVKLLREVEAVIDLQSDRLQLKKFDASTPMRVASTGHATVSVVDFGEKGWSLPIEAVKLGVREEPFRLDCFVRGGVHFAAMSGTFCSDYASQLPLTTDSALHQSHVVPPEAMGGNCKEFGGRREHVCGGWQDSNLELEAHGGKGSSLAQGRRGSGARGLARRWISYWILATAGASVHANFVQPSVKDYATAYEQAERVCREDQVRNLCGNSEVLEAGDDGSGKMPPSSGDACRSRKRSAEGSVVSRVPCQMEGGNRDSREGTIELNGISTIDPRVHAHEQSFSPIDARGDAKCEAHAGGEVRVWVSCQEADCQEGGSHEGTAFLQVPCSGVPILPMGLGGAEDDPDHLQGGRLGPVGGECRGGRGVSRREIEEEEAGGGNQKSEGGAGWEGGSLEKPGDGDRQSERGGTDYGGGVPDHRESARSIASSSSPVPPGSGALDECSGWRGENESSHERSPVPPAGHGAGDGGEEGVGGAATGEPVTKGSWTAPNEQDEMAPWMCPVRGGMQWNRAVQMQLRDEAKPEEERRVSPGFWTKDEQGKFQFHQGILPTQELSHPEVYVQVLKHIEGEDYMDEIEGSLKRGVRKRVARSMQSIEEATPKIAEVYSEPRISQKAEDMGCPQGMAFDLKNGFDFKKKSDRERCWRALEKYDPDLIVVCPPCGPFSPLQEWNYARMPLSSAMLRLEEGVEHLQFAMKVFEWQVRRGKWALFGHPAPSRAWQERAVKRCMSLHGVEKINADQCQFGLKVRPEEELNKKPTGFMSNSPKVLKRLSKKCTGDHPHQPLLHGRAARAEVYPPGLCKAVVQGIREEVKGSLLVFLGEGDGEPDDGVDGEEGLETLEEGQDEELQRMIVREEEEDERPDAVAIPCALSPKEKNLVHKVHVNLGHPSRSDFIRVMRMARARPEVLEYIRREYQCDLCQEHQKPSPARPAAIHHTYEPNKVVGVDVVYMPGLTPDEQVPVLNIVDWGTCYQVLEPVQGMSAQKIWTAFTRSWARVFGMPEIVVVDQGREFMGSFAQQAGESGSLIRVIGARAPWQNGRTERHGGIAKGVLSKVQDQLNPGDMEEWTQCLNAVEAAKNRLFNRSGFSPAQRQIGQNLRLPGSLMSDDKLEASLVCGGAPKEMQRSLRTKEAAMEEFIRFSSSESIKKAVRGRNRKIREFMPGETVYVYRKPLPRKRDSRVSGRPMWCGPGTVILTEGRNVWISMRGELWKCACEQARSATPEEEDAMELLREEFQELKENLGRKHSKRAFKDISNWEFPPEEAEIEDEVRAMRRRIGSYGEQPDPEQLPSPIEYSPEQSVQEETPSSHEEPEEERIEAMDERAVEEATRSVVHNETLDGTLHARDAREAYQPIRSRVERMRWMPYGDEIYVTEGFEVTEEEEEKVDDADEWRIDLERGKVLRIHRLWRDKPFQPTERDCPVPLKNLISARKTVKKFMDGSRKVSQGDWRQRQEEEVIGPPRSWWGYTEFTIKKKAMDKIPQVWLAKKSSDEVLEEEIKPEEWPEWRESDAQEWKKVAATKVLSEEESMEIERQLREAGTSSRILPSRIVRRWKPAEQPGQPPSRKSRWCIRGDKDPDLLYLDRFAPTLQVAANYGFDTYVADLKNAFMQSDQLVRKEGRLFCRQPKGGLPGMSPRQIIEVLLRCP